MKPAVWMIYRNYLSQIAYQEQRVDMGQPQPQLMPVKLCLSEQSTLDVESHNYLTQSKCATPPQ